MLKFSNPSTVCNTGHIRMKNVTSVVKKKHENKGKPTHCTCMFILYHRISMVRNKNACKLKNLSDEKTKMYE
jgi:hypothetical protein